MPLPAIINFFYDNSRPSPREMAIEGAKDFVQLNSQKDDGINTQASAFKSADGEFYYVGTTDNSKPQGDEGDTLIQTFKEIKNSGSI